MLLLAGSSHPEFTESIRKALSLPHSDVKIGKFANGELNVEIGVSVRDQDVYIVQTCHGSVNDALMELLIMIHACRISSAQRSTVIYSVYTKNDIVLVTAVIPYIPYAKQCSVNEVAEGIVGGPRRRSSMRRSLVVPEDESAEEYRAWRVQTNTLIASMLMVSGADRVVTMDLHDPQFQGLFNIPLENLPALPLIVKCIREHIVGMGKFILVSPDAGGAKRVAQLAEALNCDFALVHQDRNADANILIGNVKDKIAVLVDDRADTCETIVNAANLVMQKGASKIFAIIIHGIFSGRSLELIHSSPIETVFVSNTIHQEHLDSARLRSFDVACMFAEAIRRIHNGESVSHLFNPNAFQ